MVITDVVILTYLTITVLVYILPFLRQLSNRIVSRYEIYENVFNMYKYSTVDKSLSFLVGRNCYNFMVKCFTWLLGREKYVICQ